MRLDISYNHMQCITTLLIEYLIDFQLCQPLLLHLPGADMDGCVFAVLFVEWQLT